MKNILFTFLILSISMLNCKKDKNDDTVKKLFILNTLQNASKKPTFDWNYTSLPDVSTPTGLIVVQSKFWVVTEGSSSNSGSIFSSTDGATWTQSSYSGESLYDIKYINNQFVAVGGGTSSGGVIYSSPDGITWTKKATFSSSIATRLTAISGNSSYYTVAGYGGTSPNYYARSISTDLVNWTHFVTTNSSLSRAGFPFVQTVTTTGGASVISSNSSFINSCPGTCTTSGNWAISTIDSASISQQYLKELNGTAVIVATTSTGTNIYYSVNGAAFTKVTNFTPQASIFGLSVIDNKFVITSITNSGTSNQINFSYSSDGINWKSTTVSMSEGSGSLGFTLFASLNGTYVSTNSSRIFYTNSKSITFP